MPISDKSRSVALITGLGFATARVLHDRGYAVIVTGQDGGRFVAAKAAFPSDVVVLRADARSIADADRVASEVRERYGKLDVAFLNAGIGRMVPLEAVDETLYDETFDVNVKGQFFLLQKILPLLAKGSSVVFNAALGAYKGIPNWSVYSATKGAQLSLVHALAIELAPRGIRVNAVLPVPIDTPALDKLGLPAEVAAGFKDMIGSRIPLTRMRAADEVAQVVAFLGSPGAGFVTGAGIPIDGGMGA